MQKISKFHDGLRLRLDGLNFEKFLNFLKINDITLYDLQRPEYGQLIFTINNDDYAKLVKLKALRNYKVTTINEFGFKNKYIKKFKQNIGLFVGVLTCAGLFLVFSFFTFNINIMGTKKINRDEIIKVLSSKNIKVNKINDFKNSEIELLLKESFDDISLVSVIKNGTNLVINIKEKENDETQTFKPVIAEGNLIITGLEISQGTAIKKVGDIVKKGDVIVESYMVNEKNEKVPCKPIVNIKAEIWHFGQVEFETQKIVNVKTGKKIVNSYYEIFGNKILETNKTNIFKKFETKKENFAPFDNWILPITFNKTVYYEIKEKIVLQNFEQNKSNLIKESQQKAHSLVDDVSKFEESIVISELGTKKIVQTVLKGSFEKSYK